MNIAEVNELMARQLTVEEGIILKLKVNMLPGEIATKLGMSRQGVMKILTRAKRKIELQGEPNGE